MVNVALANDETVLCAYKQSDIGPIPADWRLEPMANLGQSLAGLTYSPSDVRESGTLVLRSSNVQEGRLSYVDNVFVQMEIPGRVLVREGDILICVRNGSRELIGKCARIDQNANGMAFGAFMGVFRSSINDLVFFAFQSYYVQRQIREHLGATINQITNKSLNSFLIAVPSTEREVRRIAGALSDADALIEALETLIVKKRAIMQGAMQDLLSGRKRLPGFSANWETLPLSSICTKIQDGTHFSPKTGGGDFLYVTSRNIARGFLDLRDVETVSLAEHQKIYGRCDTRKGDILLTKDGASTGNAAINMIDEQISLLSSVAMLRLDEAKHSADFFLQQILAEEGQKQIRDMMSGNAITRLTLAKIKALRFLVPPRSEQLAISDVLTCMKDEIFALEAKLAKARQIKQGMMQELLTGRVRLV
ncbi:restriction endonuclease subunit S [Amaricoccus solimangrovi]|uniref:Type I restriction modification DNA specificity domain-containing protein n=1 Tax=Amaricoccus solimangrovi TaxID=2589815 RepID=A0A501WAV3_9RHOB|nr:restriction endonuclease subunit S [Amaricoccus solimangrovi]TPE46528.1 hypothetical protein FJM51_21970 [Amaricoccus solimangrovi]